MTPQEINEAVARKLGWSIAGVDPANYYSQRWIQSVPDYCHSIEAAWEIIASLEAGWLYELSTGFGGKHLCRFVHWEKGEFEESADTAPMAICLAFLKLP